MTLNPICENVETAQGVPLTVTGVAQVIIQVYLYPEQFWSQDSTNFVYLIVFWLRKCTCECSDNFCSSFTKYPSIFYSFDLLLAFAKSFCKNLHL